MSSQPHVRLHRVGTVAYRVAGTQLLIGRRDSRSPRRPAGSTPPWYLYARHRLSRDWLDDTGLHYTHFDTLTDLKRTLSAYMHHSPPPRVAVLPRLHVTADGYRSPCGRYTITPRIGADGAVAVWQTCRDSTLVALSGSLINARYAIVCHHPPDENGGADAR